MGRCTSSTVPVRKQEPNAGNANPWMRLWLKRSCNQQKIARPHPLHSGFRSQQLLILHFLTKRSSAMRNLRDAVLSSRTGFRFLMLVAVFVLLGTLAPLSDATAPSLTITVVNNSGWEIRNL